MQTASQLLMSAPDEQVTRMQIVLRAIAKGEWSEAAHHLDNAVRETRGTEWSFQAAELREFCEETAAAC